MDRHLSQLDKDILDKAAAEHQPGNTEDDRRQGQASPEPVPKDIPECEPQHVIAISR